MESFPGLDYLKSCLPSLISTLPQGPTYLLTTRRSLCKHSVKIPCSEGDKWEKGLSLGSSQSLVRDKMYIFKKTKECFIE